MTQKDERMRAEIRYGLKVGELTQNELAERVEMNKNTLCSRMQGKTDFNVPEIRKIQQCLNINLVQFI